MRVLRSAIIAAVVAALLATAMATTVIGADKGKLTFVQGNPSAKVDVCVNGKEVASKMPFGKAVLRKFAPGYKVIKFKKASAGVCKGKLLGKKKMNVKSDTNRTIVLSKKDPKKVMSFDSTPRDRGPGPFVSPWSDGFFRHAADMDEKIFYFEVDNLTINTAFSGIWAKGTEVSRWIDEAPPGGSPQWMSTWVGDSPAYFPPMVVAGPKFAPLRSNYTHEWILIGTDKRHMLKYISRKA